jgi:hypothetical protein
MEVYPSLRVDLEDNARESISYWKVPIYRDGIFASPAAYVSHGTITETGKDRRFR